MTTQIPDYLFAIDYDVMDRDNATDYLVVDDCAPDDESGAPVLFTSGFIGNLFARYDNHTGAIHARVCDSMSLADIYNAFGELLRADTMGETYRIVLADLDFDDVMEINRNVGILSDQATLWTIEITGHSADHYEAINEAVRRLIHTDIWQSRKNVAQPPVALGVI